MQNNLPLPISYQLTEVKKNSRSVEYKPGTSPPLPPAAYIAAASLQ